MTKKTIAIIVGIVATVVTIAGIAYGIHRAGKPNSEPSEGIVGEESIRASDDADVSKDHSKKVSYPESSKEAWEKLAEVNGCDYYTSNNIDEQIVYNKDGVTVTAMGLARYKALPAVVFKVENNTDERLELFFTHCSWSGLHITGKETIAFPSAGTVDNKNNVYLTTPHTTSFSILTMKPFMRFGFEFRDDAFPECIESVQFDLRLERIASDGLDTKTIGYFDIKNISLPTKNKTKDYRFDKEAKEIYKADDYTVYYNLKKLEGVDTYTGDYILTLMVKNTTTDKTFSPSINGPDGNRDPILNGQGEEGRIRTLADPSNLVLKPGEVGVKKLVIDDTEGQIRDPHTYGSSGKFEYLDFSLKIYCENVKEPISSDNIRINAE